AGLVLFIATWQWVFWAMVPIVVVIGLAGVLSLPTAGGAQGESFDGFSAVLLACAFVALIYTLNDLSSLWDPPVVIIGLIALSIFIVRKLSYCRSHRAFLDLWPLKFAIFVLSLVVLMALAGGRFGGMRLIAFYLQEVFNASPVLAAVLVEPLLLLPAVMS